MGERTRGTVWCVRALLFAALLVGIVTMHTLGHPSSEPTPSGSAPTSAQHSATGQHAGTTTTPQHADTVTTPQHAGAAAHVTSTDGSTDGSSSHSDHGTGMDPMSVCLAVLGVWSAATLLGAAVVLALRVRPRDLLAPRRTRILRALWPLPPPSTSTRLAQLSVLRI